MCYFFVCGGGGGGAGGSFRAVSWCRAGFWMVDVDVDMDVGHRNVGVWLIFGV